MCTFFVYFRSLADWKLEAFIDWTEFYGRVVFFHSGATDYFSRLS